MAKQIGLKDSYADPINEHLLHYLLDRDMSYPIEQAMHRTQSVLMTLDALFIGTLDSLAQKWLNEYRSETGHPMGMAIVDEGNGSEGAVDTIIHDAVREFHAKVYRHQPRLYQVIQDKNKLPTVSMHRQAVTKSMNFLSA